MNKKYIHFLEDIQLLLLITNFVNLFVNCEYFGDDEKNFLDIFFCRSKSEVVNKTGNLIFLNFLISFI